MYSLNYSKERSLSTDASIRFTEKFSRLGTIFAEHVRRTDRVHTLHIYAFLCEHVETRLKIPGRSYLWFVF